MSENSDLLTPGVEIRPKITQNESRNLVEKLYGVQCLLIAELNSYDDKNYKIIVSEKVDNPYLASAAKDGYVFKITNSLDSHKVDFHEAQNEMMLYLNRKGVTCPKPVKNKNGYYLSTEIIGNSKHIVRLLEFRPGKLFCEIPLSPKVFWEIGKYVAELDLVLKDFHHPVYETRQSVWMLSNVPQVRNFLEAVRNEDDKRLVEEIIEEFERTVLGRITDLEKGILHGDINEQNIVMNFVGGEWKVGSILDFGDSQYSCLLFDLAITMTYMMLQYKDIKAGGYVMAGYETVRLLPNEEYSLLKVCIAARLCQSLVYGLYTNLHDPQNKYVLVTQKPGWILLKQLWSTDDDELLQRWKTTAKNFTNK